MTAREDLFMMPWFPRDFHHATRSWSMCAKGVYRDLLDAQWDMGVLPEDLDALKRMIGASDAEWREGWAKCAEKFPIVNGGRENRKLSYVRSIAVNKHRAHVAGGRKTQEARQAQLFDKPGNGQLSNGAEQGSSAGQLSTQPLKSEILNLKSESLELRAEQDSRSGPLQGPEAEFDRAFEQLQAIYPKRHGHQRWAEAKKHCRARIKHGYTWQQILDAAQRYADCIRSEGKERTDKVLQAATFVGENHAENFGNTWAPAPTKSETLRDKNIAASQEWLAQRQREREHG